MTQEELAVKCSSNKGYISKIDNNINEVRISALQKIVEPSEHLDLSLFFFNPLPFNQYLNRLNKNKKYT